MAKSDKTPADIRDSLGPTNTLDDLLARIRVNLREKGGLNPKQVIKRMGDLGWVANVFAGSLGKQRNRVRLSELVEGEKRFEKHLKQRAQISPERKATLHVLRNRLIRNAREFGLIHEAFEISGQWSGIRDAVENAPGGPSIVKAAIRMGRRPSDFSDADLIAWGDERKRKKRTFVYIQGAQSAFREAMRREGLESQLPLFNCQCRTQPLPRIRIASLPSKLREELKGVFECLNKNRQERA